MTFNITYDKREDLIEIECIYKNFANSLIFDSNEIKYTNITKVNQLLKKLKRN